MARLIGALNTGVKRWDYIYFLDNREPLKVFERASKQSYPLGRFASGAREGALQWRLQACIQSGG